jgi:flavin reductase (DIM6/NTAB) family NADH-FMN oxidoreductase RutF
MHYDTETNRHGLRHDPFKALIVPRPIGWISTVDGKGVRNLAPYSFFNAISDRPPVVLFSSGGRKDSLRNIEETGEFTCSLAIWDLREQMNLSSATVAPGIDEFEVAGLEAAPSRFVKPPRVARSPAAFECRHWKTVEMPAPDSPSRPTYSVVFGLVVGIYIDDAYVKDGIVDAGAMRPLARLGYMDYSVVTPETIFSMNRPAVAEDGKSASVNPEAWDGVYR